MDAREWLDYIADGKLSSVWALSEKLAWEKAQSEVVSCREKFPQLLDRLSGTSNRLGRGLRCVCCAIAQGCRLGAIEVVSENAPILLAWEKATKEMERFRSFKERSLWYESYGFVESSPQTEHLRTESRALELYSSLEAIPLMDELKEVFVPVYEAVTFIAEQEQYRTLLPTPLLEALQYEESPADEATLHHKPNLAEQVDTPATMKDAASVDGEEEQISGSMPTREEVLAEVGKWYALDPTNKALLVGVRRFQRATYKQIYQEIFGKEDKEQWDTQKKKVVRLWENFLNFAKGNGYEPEILKRLVKK